MLIMFKLLWSVMYKTNIGIFFVTKVGSFALKYLDDMQKHQYTFWHAALIFPSEFETIYFAKSLPMLVAFYWENERKRWNFYVFLRRMAVRAVKGSCLVSTCSSAHDFFSIYNCMVWAAIHMRSNLFQLIREIVFLLRSSKASKNGNH